MKRLLCIWLPGWPIQRLLSRTLTPIAAELDAALVAAETQHESSSTPLPRRMIDRPLVLWDTDPRRGRLVVACCRRAIAAGIRVGMPIAGANELAKRGQELATKNPDPLLQQHDRWLDQVALKRIASDLQQQISPLVALETLDDHPWAGRSLHQAQALLCDVTGIAHLFGGEQSLIRAVQKRLDRFGCIGRIAIADHSAAAWSLAHYATQSRHQSGCDATETVIAPPGMTSEYVASLDIKALRIPPATVSTLHRLGIHQISQLLALPRGGLATRLGETLVRRLSEVLGEAETLLQVHRTEAADIHSMELEYPSGDEKILADRIERLIEKVRAGLATRQRGALRVTCRLALSNLPPLTFEVGLFAPTLDVGHLTGLLVSAIEAKPLPAPVTHITVEVTLSGPLRNSQASLFAKESLQSNNVRDDDWMRDPDVARLIDALAGRLGRESVIGVAINDNPLPEKAVAAFPLTGNQALHKQRKGRQRELLRSQNQSTLSYDRGSMHENEFWFHQKSSFLPRRENPLRRPLILLTTPQKILPHPHLPHRHKPNSTELPQAFQHGGKIFQIVRHWGPERIETDWWLGESMRRDYYRIETNLGHWWWIFRCLGRKQDQWMLHGYF